MLITNQIEILTPEVLINSFSLDTNYMFTDMNMFSQYIELRAIHEDKTNTAVILEYCDDKDIEPDEVAKYISPSLKGKIHQEMVESGLLKNENSLFD